MHRCRYRQVQTEHYNRNGSLKKNWKMQVCIGDNIKTYVKEIGFENVKWIDIFQDRFYVICEQKRIADATIEELTERKTLEKVNIYWRIITKPV